MPMNLRRSARQTTVGLAIVGLHVALVAVWWTSGRAMQWVHRAPTLATTTVWLPPPTPRTISPAPLPLRQQPVRAPSEPSRQPDSRPTEPGSTANTAPAMAAGSTALPTSGPSSADTPPQSAPALNLTLSRKAIASIAPPSFAEQSPFHGRLPATVERQIASAAAETGPWTEERMDNDHIRFRRGNTCVTIERPRAAAIDPFSEAAGRIPWRASLPEHCGP